MKAMKRLALFILNYGLVIVLSFANHTTVLAQAAQTTKSFVESKANAAIVAFNKTTPANGAVIPMPASTYHVLEWTDALIPETDRYQYCIDQTNNNTCENNNWVSRINLYSGSPNEFSIAPGSTYYWQVRVRDANVYANGGTWWSFTTSNVVVPVLDKTTPANGAVIAMPASTYYLLQWTDLLLPDTDRYQYCIDTTNNNSCDDNNWITRDSLYSGSDEFTLVNGSTYYWQVRARDANVYANGGAWWSFSISGSPPSFGKTTPANGASIPMPANTYYLLQWTDLFLPSTDRYQYCIDQTNNNSCDGNNWITRPNLYSGSEDFTLEFGKTYYWQVKARDAGTQADSGTWWSFSISGSAPSFGKTTPANGASIPMPATSYYLLQWTDLFLPSTDRYQYCIDTTNNNSCDGNVWVTRNSLYSGGLGDITLEYGKTYYWQVRARDAGTLADGGTWWSFTISGSPPTFGKISPANGAIFATPPDTYYLLQWTDLFLPSTDRYQYCIDTTNNNACDSSWITRPNLYSGGPGEFTLTYGTTYYWQVKARDAGTVADGGTWWSFTIQALAPAPSVVSIVRVDPDPAASSSQVHYTVTFDQSVTGVDESDFTLNTAIIDAFIVSVSGSGSTRDVTVNTGTGGGTIRLDFADDDTVQNSQTSPIGGVGMGNGNFNSGQIYTITP